MERYALASTSFSYNIYIYLAIFRVEELITKVMKTCKKFVNYKNLFLAISHYY